MCLVKKLLFSKIKPEAIPSINAIFKANWLFSNFFGSLFNSLIFSEYENIEVLSFTRNLLALVNCDDNDNCLKILRNSNDMFLNLFCKKERRQFSFNGTISEAQIVDLTNQKEELNAQLVLKDSINREINLAFLKVLLKCLEDVKNGMDGCLLYLIDNLSIKELNEEFRNALETELRS